jgi:hypothetical protein
MYDTNEDNDIYFTVKNRIEKSILSPDKLYCTQCEQYNILVSIAENNDNIILTINDGFDNNTKTDIISKIEYNKFKINGDFTDYIQKPYENSFDNICIFIENTNYMLSMSDYFLPIYNLY